MPSAKLSVALLGSPNSGKTALYNRLTGSKQKVANYAGVTVERKEGIYTTASGNQITVLDLPGLYSVTTMGQDEEITRSICLGHNPSVKPLDLIICLVDATNLRLHLKLALEVKELVAYQKIPVVVVVNQMDMAESRGIQIDLNSLAQEIGCIVIPTVAIQPSGIDRLKDFLNDFSPVKTLAVKSKPERRKTVRINSTNHHQQVRQIIAKSVIMPSKTSQTDDRLDRIFLHPIGGLLILLLILFMLFQAVFLLAQPFMDGIEYLFDLLKSVIDLTMGPSLLHSFITEAVISGSGAVLVFIPQIIILFFFILFLEESGYLPRAAFLLDSIMARFGLSGRAFIPLLSSFACAIPGIMATRTIHDYRDRLTTIMIAPLMTCSARLPVYTLLIGAFIPERHILGFMSLQGLVMLALYFAGIISGLVVAKIVSLRQNRKMDSSLIFELPSYRMPKARNLALALWERAVIFIKRISGIIFAVNALLWFLVSFPRPSEQVLASGVPAIQSSFAGIIGNWIQPIMAPLGFNWQITVALIPGLAAREVAVSALGTVYAVGAKGSDTVESLQQILAKQWSLATALSLLAWYVFAPQCLATLAVIRRETNSRFLSLVAASYLFLLAYLASYATFKISSHLIG